MGGRRPEARTRPPRPKTATATAMATATATADDAAAGVRAGPSPGPRVSFVRSVLHADACQSSAGACGSSRPSASIRPDGMSNSGPRSSSSGPITAGTVATPGRDET